MSWSQRLALFARRSIAQSPHRSIAPSLHRSISLSLYRAFTYRSAQELYRIRPELEIAGIRRCVPLRWRLLRPPDLSDLLSRTAPEDRAAQLISFGRSTSPRLS